MINSAESRCVIWLNRIKIPIYMDSILDAYNKTFSAFHSQSIPGKIFNIHIHFGIENIKKIISQYNLMERKEEEKVRAKTFWKLKINSNIAHIFVYC